MIVQVQRRWYAPDNAQSRASITGTLSLDGAQTCFTLEPASLSVPSGSYGLKMVWSHRFDRMTPHLLGVPGRTNIELHGGNKAEDSEGCILCAEFRLNEYEIYESKEATDAIERALQNAEANGEINVITILDMAVSA